MQALETEERAITQGVCLVKLEYCSQLPKYNDYSG